MSEYQYYEFLAIDHPLTSSELEKVRALSTRAQITPTHFSNEYHWGDFRGDPRRLMERFYDAHLYLANWGTRQVMLRLPTAQLPHTAVEPYLCEEAVEAWTHGRYTILDLRYSPDEADDWDESDESALSAIVGVRTELAAGDLRALYLAWLVGLALWELQEDDEEAYCNDHEPPVPAGLAQLTGPQRALADFLHLDDDLLAAAAAASPPLDQAPGRDPRLVAWIANLPAEEKDALLLRAAQGSAPHLGPELLGRYRADTAAPPAAHAERRTAAELLDAAAVRRTARARRETEERASAERRRAQREAAAHEARLIHLAEHQEEAWRDVDRLISAKRSAEYDAAVSILQDLHEVCGRTDTTADFNRRVRLLHEEHQRRPALLRRLEAARILHP